MDAPTVLSATEILGVCIIFGCPLTGGPSDSKGWFSTDPRLLDALVRFCVLIAAALFRHKRRQRVRWCFNVCGVPLFNIRHCYSQLN